MWNFWYSIIHAGLGNKYDFKLMDKRWGYITRTSIMHIYIVCKIPMEISQILTKKCPTFNCQRHWKVVFEKQTKMTIH